MTDTYKQFAVRTENIAAFRNTVMSYTGNPELKASTARSSADQKVYRAYDILRNLPDGIRNAKIVLTPRKTLEAARAYAAEGKKVAVLNCASAVKPGGETESGYASQEEALCRCTNLYPCLNSTDAVTRFYAPHRSNLNAPHTMNSCLTTDDCIYTPDVTVIKEDGEGYKMYDEEDWFNIDVISCSAPEFLTAFTSPFISGFNRESAEDDRIKKENVYKKRFERILNIARLNGADVVILDFWGYKRSEEDALIVSEAAHKAAESFISFFEEIEMAVGYSCANRNTYDVYSRAFGETEPYPARAAQTV